MTPDPQENRWATAGGRPPDDGRHEPRSCCSARSSTPSSPPEARPSGSAPPGRSSIASPTAASATSRSPPRHAAGTRGPTSGRRASCGGSCDASGRRCCTRTTRSPGCTGGSSGGLAGVPIVVNTVHGLYATPDDPLPERVVVYVAEAFASRWSDVELVQNVEDVELMRRCRLAPRRKLRHLGNGVDLAAVPARGARTGRAAPAPGRVGRRRRDGRRRHGRSTGRREGLPRAVRRRRPVAVRTSASSSSAATDPDKPDALDAEVLRRADDAGVVLLGHRDDVDRLLGGFDVFVLASHREGQPRAAMEAAATGLPIVATDIRGCRQVVDDGSPGCSCRSPTPPR